eukprot:COSAG04_NODE_11287_length_718_cov_1.791599_3_plen_44_part_01
MERHIAQPQPVARHLAAILTHMPPDLALRLVRDPDVMQARAVAG